MKSSMGGGVYALSEMVGHMLPLKGAYGPFEGMGPGVGGLEDSESLLTHLKKKKITTKKYLARHFLNIQQAFGGGDLENAHWLPGTENPADRLTRVRRDMAPLLRLLGTGSFFRDIVAL